MAYPYSRFPQTDIFFNHSALNLRGTTMSQESIETKDAGKCIYLGHKANAQIHQVLPN